MDSNTHNNTAEETSNKLLVDGIRSLLEDAFAIDLTNQNQLLVLRTHATTGCEDVAHLKTVCESLTDATELKVLLLHGDVEIEIRDPIKSPAEPIVKSWSPDEQAALNKHYTECNLDPFTDTTHKLVHWKVCYSGCVIPEAETDEQYVTACEYRWLHEQGFLQ